MNRHWKIIITFFAGLILINSCGENEPEDCDFFSTIKTNIKNAHPCNPTGGIEIISPIGKFKYKLDKGKFQSKNIFENVSAGKHTITIKDCDGCLLAREVNVDTLPQGSRFKEVSFKLKTNCRSCHSDFNPQAGLDFTAPCDILKYWDRIQARAVDGNPTTMPPTGFISLEDRNKILEWLRSGHKYED
jgi:hypothetical protein